MIKRDNLEFTIHRLGNGKVYCKTLYKGWYFCFPVKCYTHGLDNITFEILKFRKEIDTNEYNFNNIPKNSTVTQLLLEDF